MPAQAYAEVQTVLDLFAEKLTGLMIDHYQRQITELDLTLQQAQALRILRREALTTGKLAEVLGISAPAITQLTDRLVRKGLIERRNCVEDRRCVIVALTERGSELVDAFRERRREVFSGAIGRLSVPEREQVYKALGTMAAAFEEDVAGATAGADKVSKSTVKVGAV